MVLGLHGVLRLAIMFWLLVWLATPQAGAAQAVAAVGVQLDNDLLSFWLPPQQRSDANYTNGLRLTLDVNRAPWWGRRFARHAAPCAPDTSTPTCLTTGFVLGQHIYTPVRDSVYPIPGERPYAGWLYMGVSARAVGRKGVESVTVQLGVVGPPSLAGTVQTALHSSRSDLSRPLGWQHQLAFEPGLLVSYSRSRILLEGQALGVRVFELVPHWGATAGNVLTGAHGGITLRLGYNVPGPPGWPGHRDGGLALYTLGGLRENLVLRNLFLDGSTFRASPRVEKLPFVAEWEFGGGIQFRGFLLEYRARNSTREYETQQAGHRYGAILAGFHRSY
jgi:lipid A 3-O-deacylase